MAVKWVGWIHGILFIGFMIAVVMTAFQYKWSLKRVAFAFIAALLPFGTFIFDASLKKEQLQKADIPVQPL
jgi:integral membrane protein